jgi:rubrerythrin
MDVSESTTFQNLVAAFSGEAMANRKYLFFADVARKIGYTDIAKLFNPSCYL